MGRATAAKKCAVGFHRNREAFLGEGMHNNNPLIISVSLDVSVVDPPPGGPNLGMFVMDIFFWAPLDAQEENKIMTHRMDFLFRKGCVPH